MIGMSLEPLVTIQINLLVLLAVACLAAIARKWLRFPYSVVLVLVGIGAGWFGQTDAGREFLQPLTLSHDLILFVFVPPLVFESALNLDSRLLFRNLPPILTLAGPGLLLSTAIVGGILSWGTPLALPQALLFGSLISATDPVAVIALFKELGAPQRLGVLIEGESLFNDATAIVAFNIILAAIATGQGFGSAMLQQGGINFLISFVGGIVVGMVIGRAIQPLLSLSRQNPLVLFTLTTVIAYATFLLAEAGLHISGVLAVVSAGMTLGRYKNDQLKTEVRHALGEFWEYVAFLANSLLFLLMGITVAGLGFFQALGQWPVLWGAMGLTLVAILLARGVAVFGLMAVVNRCSPRSVVPVSYQFVSFWGGLRGAVCLALVLSLEATFPQRDLLLMLTLAVVLFTLLVPATTIATLLHRLQLDIPPLFERLNLALARVLAKHKALIAMSELAVSGLTNSSMVLDPDIVRAYQQHHQGALTLAQQELSGLLQHSTLTAQTRQQWIWLLALSLERQVYQESYDNAYISEELFAALRSLVEFKRDEVLAGHLPPTHPPVYSTVSDWGAISLALGKRLCPKAGWVKQQHVRLQLDTCLYWGVTEYLAQPLEQHLQQLFQDSRIDPDLLQPCLAQYRTWQQQAHQRLIQEASPERLRQLEELISEKVAEESEQDTLKKWVEIGAISSATQRALKQSSI